jgi:hypothetical protein
MIQKNATAGQNENNFFKTTKNELGCCDGEKLDCQYTATYTQANTVSALTIIENGEDVVLPLSIAGGASAATVQAALMAALEVAEYYDDNDPDWVGVVVTDLGTTLQIVITGNINVKSLTASGGTSTFDGDCEIVGLCTFSVTGFTGGASFLHINGVAVSIGTITPGTTAEGTVDTAVDAALTAQGVSGTSASADQTTTYDLTITGVPKDTTLYAVGTSGVKFYLERSNCVQDYI